MNKSNQFSNTEGTILERIKQVSADGGGRKYPEWDENELSSILLTYQTEALADEMEVGEVEIKYALKLIEYFVNKIDEHAESVAVLPEIIKTTIDFAEQSKEFFRSDCIATLKQMELDGMAIKNIYNCIVTEEGRIADEKEAEQQ